MLNWCDCECDCDNYCDYDYDCDYDCDCDKVRGIDPEKCRVMESAKKPLWLSFMSAKKGEKNIIIMLKVGDDLRQDALILQLLNIMNDIWRKEGLDMQMMLYDCISTGDERGLLQVVQNATTLASILLDASDEKISAKAGTLRRKLHAAGKALGDFNVIRDWIWQQVGCISSLFLISFVMLWKYVRVTWCYAIAL